MPKARRNLRLIRVAGSPAECGRAIGAASSKAIRECHAAHSAEYQPYCKAWEGLAQVYYEAIKKVAPKSAAELEGIAEGAGVALSVILSLYCVEELDVYVSAYPWLCNKCSNHIPPGGGFQCVSCSFAVCTLHAEVATHHPHPMQRVQPPQHSRWPRQGKSRGLCSLEKPGHCTSFAATSAATVEDLPEGIAGQTFDWAPRLFSFGRNDAVWQVQEPDSPECLVYANPGVPNGGLNSAGLCVLCNTVYSSELGFAEGIPTAVVTRELLRCHSLDEGLAFLRRVPLAIPFNYMLLHGNRIANIECSPIKRRQSNAITAEVYFHTNHFLDQSFSAVEIAPSCNTLERYDAIRTHVLPEIPLDRSAVLRIFATPPILGLATLGTIVCLPHKRALLVRFGSKDAEGMSTDPRKLQWREYRMQTAARLPAFRPSPCLADTEIPTEESSVVFEPNDTDTGESGRTSLLEATPVALELPKGSRQIPTDSDSQKPEYDGSRLTQKRHLVPGAGEYECCDDDEDGRFSICCDTCDRWFHGACVAVSTVFQEAHYQRSGRAWHCDGCLKGRGPAPSTRKRRCGVSHRS